MGSPEQEIRIRELAGIQRKRLFDYLHSMPLDWSFTTSLDYLNPPRIENLYAPPIFQPINIVVNNKANASNKTRDRSSYLKQGKNIGLPERILIIGPSGSGKTMLLKMLAMIMSLPESDVDTETHNTFLQRAEEIGYSLSSAFSSTERTVTPTVIKRWLVGTPVFIEGKRLREVPEAAFVHSAFIEDCLLLDRQEDRHLLCSAIFKKDIQNAFLLLDGIDSDSSLLLHVLARSGLNVIASLREELVLQGDGVVKESIGEYCGWDGKGKSRCLRICIPGDAVVQSTENGGENYPRICLPSNAVDPFTGERYSVRLAENLETQCIRWFFGQGRDKRYGIAAAKRIILQRILTQDHTQLDISLMLSASREGVLPRLESDLMKALFETCLNSQAISISAGDALTKLQYCASAMSNKWITEIAESTSADELSLQGLLSDAYRLFGDTGAIARPAESRGLDNPGPAVVEEHEKLRQAFINLENHKKFRQAFNVEEKIKSPDHSDALKKSQEVLNKCISKDIQDFVSSGIIIVCRTDKDGKKYYRFRNDLFQKYLTASALKTGNAEQCKGKAREPGEHVVKRHVLDAINNRWWREIYLYYCEMNSGLMIADELLEAVLDCEECSPGLKLDFAFDIAARTRCGIKEGLIKRLVEESLNNGLSDYQRHIELSIIRSEYDPNGIVNTIREFERRDD